MSPDGEDLGFVVEGYRYARAFELEPGSSTSKFGGVILFDAFDADGRPLGTVLHVLLSIACVADDR